MVGEDAETSPPSAQSPGAGLCEGPAKKHED